MNTNLNTARLHSYVKTHTNYRVTVLGDSHIVTRKTWGGIDIEVGCLKDGVFRNHWTDTTTDLFLNIRGYLDQLDSDHDSLLALWPRPSVMLTLTELCLYVKTYSKMEVTFGNAWVQFQASHLVKLSYSRVHNTLDIMVAGDGVKTFDADHAFLELCQRIEDLTGGFVKIIEAHDRDVYNLRLTSHQKKRENLTEQLAQKQKELEDLQRQLEATAEEETVAKEQLERSVETCPHPERAAWALPS